MLGFAQLEVNEPCHTIVCGLFQRRQQLLCLLNQLLYRQVVGLVGQLDFLPVHVIPAKVCRQLDVLSVLPLVHHRVRADDLALLDEEFGFHRVQALADPQHDQFAGDGPRINSPTARALVPVRCCSRGLFAEDRL